ncbi:hypothetical protein JRO89_XS06G0158900 [Xanthoceras sorbifolium]|uniref:PGG domain-containing protein n=1 Tax=Xanthoceras sorbifolium TaxID=99658 RepID=A0ABQ8HYI5_9ROSI|nr:hypothetical protein JRO89_XS06G0158900 [Xanthoceras sorbifolium]
MNKDLSNNIDDRLLCPVSVDGVNIVHLAVHSGSKEPLNQMLSNKDLVQSFTGAGNEQGNTVLHDAAAVSQNLEAVRFLVELNDELLLHKKTNDNGETPLFSAAAFGNTKIVKFLAQLNGQSTINSDDGITVQLRDIHRRRNDGASILHAAVQGKNFGTALELPKMDEKLAELKDKNGTSLVLLARIPSVLKGGRQMGIGKKLLHFCVPVGCGNNDDADNLEKKDEHIKSSSVLRKGCPAVRKIWKEKREHKFALELAEKLVEKDKTWEDTILQYVFFGPPKVKEDEEESETPLFAAIRTGNTQLAKLILDEHPMALELINHMNQNILHMAASYRQREIFDFLKEKKIPMRRLARKIDAKGYTILHYCGRNPEKEAYSLHKKAQKWIKETSQSCSAVAVLVATVVFAAAFTVPGGTTDENGLPILLNSPLFLFFTVTDIVSLSCSLTSVVMFLSVFTSPFELEDFYVSVPRRLTLGFALLFMPMAATMLAFTSTIFLVIRLDQRRRWTMTLICCAAFFPVSVLALTHFPLFVSFINAWKDLFTTIRNAPPCS